MISGLSYQNGVLFLGKRYIGGAYIKKNRPVMWSKPLGFKTLISIGFQVFAAMPKWFKAVVILWGLSVFMPFVVNLVRPDMYVWGLPIYSLFFLAYGTHFIFPTRLRKFHGAEHKVFSFKGIKKIGNMTKIKHAAITNRYCSTNVVVLFFTFVMIGFILLSLLTTKENAIAWATYSAAFLSPLLHKRMLKVPGFSSLLLACSYALQRHVTCSEPDRIHLLTAVKAYRALAVKEFPSLLKEKERVSKRKEHENMAIVDITIVPIGTDTTSLSRDVANIQKVLEKHEEKINYQLTPMSTIIEGKLEDLFNVIKELHEIPFELGHQRVSTNIRIDDRRDKDVQMKNKVQSVEEKLKQ